MLVSFHLVIEEVKIVLVLVNVQSRTGIAWYNNVCSFLLAHDNEVERFAVSAPVTPSVCHVELDVVFSRSWK